MNNSRGSDFIPNIEKLNDKYVLRTYHLKIVRMVSNDMPSLKEIAIWVFWVFAAVSLFWVGFEVYYLAETRTDTFLIIGAILVLLWIYLIYRSSIE